MASIVSRTQASGARLPLWQAGIVAILATTLAAVIVYSIASAAGTLPDSVPVPTPNGEEPITLAPAILASAQGALAAAIVYALLRRLTARPDRILWLIGGSVLALSLIPVFAIDDAPAKMIVTLLAMHVAAGLTAIGTLTRLTRP